MKSNISREKTIELIREMRAIIESKVELLNYFDNGTLRDKEDDEDIELDLQGVSNGFLSEILYAILGFEIEVFGDAKKLFPCPCCGFRTLTEVYNPLEGTGYDICPYCKWEDDGTEDIKMYSSINKGSIEDYRNNMRENYNKYYINKWYE